MSVPCRMSYQKIKTLLQSEKFTELFHTVYNISQINHNDDGVEEKKIY